MFQRWKWRLLSRHKPATPPPLDCGGDGAGPAPAGAAHDEPQVRGKPRLPACPGLRFMGCLQRVLAVIYALVFLVLAGFQALVVHGNPNDAKERGSLIAICLAIPVSYLPTVVGAELCHILVQASAVLNDLRSRPED